MHGQNHIKFVVLVVQSCLLFVENFRLEFYEHLSLLWPKRQTRHILRLPQEMHKFYKNLKF